LPDIARDRKADARGLNLGRLRQGQQAAFGRDLPYMRVVDDDHVVGASQLLDWVGLEVWSERRSQSMRTPLRASQSAEQATKGS
jgi:hypothetical protein